MHSTRQPSTLFRFLLIVILLMVASGLGYAVLALPESAPGLSGHVAENLQRSGVENPVTAVLLNYRAYDTLLELGVLLLALIAVWSLGSASNQHSNQDSNQQHSQPSLVLDTLARSLVPLLIIMAGYLLWIGANAPGGAFQAGAMLAAAGVLLLLSGWKLFDQFNGFVLRFTLVMGLAVFMLVGVVMIILDRQFLELPPALAPALILLIEAAATISIAVALVALFLGGAPKSRKP